MPFRSFFLFVLWTAPSFCRGFTTIHVDDFLTGDAQTKRIIANQVDKAMHDLGFFFLSYTNVIPDAVIDNVYTSAKNFFAQPIEHKMKYRSGRLSEGQGTGYAPTLSIQTGDYPSTMESFSFTNKSPYIFERSLPSWDTMPPELSIEVLRAYNHSMNKMLGHLHEIATLALNLSTNFFDDYMSVEKAEGVPAITVRLNSYTPEECSEDEKCGIKDGLGEHTDILGFTLLYTDSARGLQTRDENGEWIDVALSGKRDRILVVNTGDIISRWTNGHWKAASHRVNAVDECRISIVYFSGPMWNHRIAPFPDCEVCNREDFKFEDNRGQTAKEYKDARLLYYDALRRK